MMGMLLIFAALATHQLEGILVKQYGKKHSAGGMVFNAVICLAATVYFFLSDTDGLQFPKQILLYGLGNSLLYATGFYTTYLAFQCGSFGFTKLFSSLGTILIVFYGVFVLHEPATALMFVALALLFAAVYLLCAKEQDTQQKQKISIKWVVYMSLTVLSNALITIVGKAKHNIFGDAYNNEFLILSLGGSAAFLLVMGWLFERNQFKPALRYGLTYGIAAGLCNGIHNVLILLTYNYLPISVISPFKTGLGMVMSFLVSMVLYKETFSRRQWLGIGIGIVSIILINL